MEPPEPSKQSDSTSSSTTLSSEKETTTAMRPTTGSGKVERHKDVPSWRPERFSLLCNDDKSFPGHADVSPSEVFIVAGEVCKQADKENWSLGPNETLLEVVLEDVHTHRHRISWSWIDRCSMGEGHRFRVADPLELGLDDALGATNQCHLALCDAWGACDNGGVGGSVDVGCIRYRIDSGI
ncbi:hypothetical protein FGADI_9281 [Fusarium gaditjirri]|uniref:Uncharacterized protein n=1 Tax=Fusarium gaditjirri TaxID=282569 RepID=A0A8H4T0G4_9HYPO|nr:hypothetical protein FGADI_9281 [Fusarium gaditjirri]